MNIINKIKTSKPAEFARTHKVEILTVSVTVVAATIGIIAFKKYCDDIDAEYAGLSDSEAWTKLGMNLGFTK